LPNVKTALVLGGGGVTGAAWLVGALTALEAETGWDVGRADRVIGTSAGSVIGALLCAGVRPGEMAGDNAEPAREPGADRLAERLGHWGVRVGLPIVGVGSWPLALSTSCRPHRHPLPVVLAGWMPRGFLSTDPIRELVEAYAGRVWPAGGRFRAVAADYRSGRRVAFGGVDAPVAELPDAVAASCAIPSIYQPVRIDGREYVDGGICSASNLDLVRGTDVDLVVCVNPLSTRGVVPHDGSLGGRLTALWRAEHGRRLGHEARKLRHEGKHAILLQPGRDDVEVMGTNFLSGGRRPAIVEQARRSVTAQLRELRDGGQWLPAGAAVARPGAAHSA
jgi:NTE family protein